MKYNQRAEECQVLTLQLMYLKPFLFKVFMDIDCRRYTYDTEVNPVIRDAAAKARKANTDYKSEYSSQLRELEVMESLFQRQTMSGNDAPFIQNDNIGNEPDSNQTESRKKSLKKSMISYLHKKKLSKEVLEEAFCRDIDAFNLAFVVSHYTNLFP